MFRRSCCRFFVAWFVFSSTSSLVKSTTPSPTLKGAEDDASDTNIIYLIVAPAGFFLIVVMIIVMVSCWQTKKPVVTRDDVNATVVDPAVINPTDMNQHQPGMNQHQPGMNQHQPGMNQHQPGMNQHQPGMNQHQPGMNQHQPVVNPRMVNLTQFPDHPHSRSNNSGEAIGLSERSFSNHKNAWWEIPGKDLRIYHDKVLGSGQFGVVLLCHVLKDNAGLKCAVKTLKDNATMAEKKSLKKELENMAGMDPHPNIVNLIGAQTLGVNLLVVVEYCEHGSLYDYLKKNRSNYVTKLRIAFDVANGMSYLAAKKFVHRDLAARNVLLDGELKAKVSDFGRSRDINKMFLKGYESVRMKNEPIPTRWMPVETLMYQVFTTKSDVWSYGVLLWEIESRGVRPYNSEQTYHQVVDKVVHQGYRLPQPSFCPDVVYRIMKECWNDEAEKRPTFAEISEIIGNLLKEIISPTKTVSEREVSTNSTYDLPIRS